MDVDEIFFSGDIFKTCIVKFLSVGEKNNLLSPGARGPLNLLWVALSFLYKKKSLGEGKLFWRPLLEIDAGRMEGEESSPVPIIKVEKNMLREVISWVKYSCQIPENVCQSIARKG